MDSSIFAPVQQPGFGKQAWRTYHMQTAPMADLAPLKTETMDVSDDTPTQPPQLPTLIKVAAAQPRKQGRSRKTSTAEGRKRRLAHEKKQDKRPHTNYVAAFVPMADASLNPAPKPEPPLSYPAPAPATSFVYKTDCWASTDFLALSEKAECDFGF